MEYVQEATKVSDEEIDGQIASIVDNLRKIYSNKSTEEYKCGGTITKISQYTALETVLSYLRIIKGFPSVKAEELKTLFNTLHRPIWKQMITKFIAYKGSADDICSDPDAQRCVLFTLLFTTGYRVLMGETARIIASTEATEKGFVYRPNSVSKQKDMSKFIRRFNGDLERNIDNYIINTTKLNIVHQESASTAILGAVDEILGTVSGVVVRTFNILNGIFSTAKDLNPVSLMNALLSRSYQKKIDKFNNAATMFRATKQAYDEYMKLPANKRKEKVESKYIKNIEKYNIKMEDLRAQIDHYDKRAHEEADDDVMTAKKRRKMKREMRNRRREERKANKQKKNTSSDKSDSNDKNNNDNNSTGNNDNDGKKVDNPNNGTASEQEESPKKDDNDDFDWDF